METISRYCALTLFALIATAAAAQPTKIGYVNVVRIENESALAKASLEQLKKEFAPREQQQLAAGVALLKRLLDR